MPELHVPPIVIVMIQAILGLLTALILFLLAKLFSELKDNTANTVTLAKASAVTDVKVEAIERTVGEVRQKVHKIGEQVTILETRDQFRATRKAQHS